MTSDANREQAEFWDEIAPNWIEAERHSAVVSGPFGEAAMDGLGLLAGERVLDIGCGTGDTTADLAARVAPDGVALGVDIAPGMIAEARRRHGGVGNAEFDIADLQVDDVGGERYDAAFSRFGVMFFADPTAAFTNIRSRIASGGRLAFCCWQDLFSNEWMFVPGSAVITVTGTFPPMPGPGEPGPFSLADPDVIREVLAAAGFTEIEIDQQSRVVDLPESAVESVVALSSRVGPVREALRESDDEHLRDRLLAGVRQALHDKVSDGRLRLTAAANIVSARA